MHTDSTGSGLLKLSGFIDGGIDRICKVICWSYLILVLVIILQIVLRKGFAHGLIALEELQWHLYAVGFLFGLSYAQIKNNHVRVDLLHHNFSEKTKAKVEILGILLLAFPFLATLFWHSIPFAYDAWRIGESSSSPSGLPMRWLIKSAIPVSMALLILAMFSTLLKKFDVLFLSEKRGVQHGH